MKSYRFLAGLRGQLLVLLIILTLVPLIIMSWVSYFSAQGALRTQATNQLISVRETKRSELVTYFATIHGQVLSLSESTMVVDAMQEFSNGFEGLANIQQSAEVTERLESYYQDEFIPRLNENLLEPQSAETYLPTSANTISLQHFFISRNPNPIGEKDSMVTSPLAPPEYSEPHRHYHPIFRSYLERFGYYDIFLVDTSGNIVYSVSKKTDFATNLLRGPYRTTSFAEAFRLANASDDKEFVQLVDFEPYAPSYHAPASFIASPIFDGDKHVGVLMFQMPVDALNEIMTNFHDWEGMGLGQSGEVFLVGSDNLMRSIGRDLNADNDAIATHLGTTILQRHIKTVGTDAAFNGEIDTLTYNNYHDVPVLGAFSPLPIEGVDWVLVAEIDHEEAFAAVNTLGQRLVLLTSIIAAMTIVIAIWMANSISKPLVVFGGWVARLADGDTSLELPASKPSSVMNDVRVGMEHMIDYLQVKVDEANQIADGNVPAQITIDSQQDSLGFALQKTAVWARGVQDKATVTATNLRETSNHVATLVTRLERRVAQFDQLVSELTTSAENEIPVELPLQRLATQTASINELTTTIHRLADQTNQLAVDVALHGAQSGNSEKVYELTQTTRHIAQALQALPVRVQPISEGILELLAVGIVQERLADEGDGNSAEQNPVHQAIRYLEQTKFADQQIVDSLRLLDETLKKVADDIQG